MPGGQWATGTKLPVSFAETTAAVIDCRIYIPGGLDAGGIGSGGRIRDLDQLLVYEPGTDTYSQKAAPPEGRNHPGVAVLDGKLYVSGGYSIVTGKTNLWSYDPSSDAWTVLADMPGPRAAHTLIGYAGKLYVIGGVINGTRDWTPVWVYDVASNTWSTDAAPLPTQREHVSGAEVGGKLYVIGGRFLSNMATVEIYDPVADRWAAGPDRPHAASAMTLMVLDGVIHTTGGEDINRLVTLADHDALDTATMTWSTLAPLPSKRHGTFSGEVNGRWYVMGGGRAADLAVSNIVEVWTP